MFGRVRSRPVQLNPERRVNDRRFSERRVHHAMTTTCPRCGSDDIRRSATRLWERPLRWFSPLVPFRCRVCDWRGWRRPDPPKVDYYGGGLDDEQSAHDQSDLFTDETAPKAT
jgi:hypothetical protein